MADKTKIEWTDATWNPITGCSIVSEGCTNCYAMRLAGGRMQHHWSRVGLTKSTARGPIWNGRVKFNEEWRDQPLRWRRPRRIFVCAHGDLFHNDVPDAWIDRVFTVMAMAPHHQFQVLTKRAARMREYMTTGFHRSSLHLKGWPLPNVWLGVSAENQAMWDERTSFLLRTPATLKFVSVEPLLGPIDTRGSLKYGQNRIDWIIVGGESGPRARPMNPAWARTIRNQCLDLKVPFFFKQWGEWEPQCAGWVVLSEANHYVWDTGDHSFRVNKKGIGRFLDGREWNNTPNRSIVSQKEVAV